MSDSIPLSPRQIAAMANRSKRRGLTPEGSAKLRKSALKHRPWENSTGPRTAAGKARSAANGRARQKGLLSGSQVRALIADAAKLAAAMAVLRERVGR